MHNCEIICVGTELLLGDILNTNVRFLSKELAAMGIAVLHQSVIGDNSERLANELRAALSRSDIVITSGGLGPTPDDLTKEVCCEVMGFELAQDDSVLEDIKSFFNKKGICMAGSNNKQAFVPVGGTVFRNANGTAPGAAMEKDGKCLVLLPGPPRELEPMFIKQVKPFLKKYSSGVIISHTVRTMGIGESAMAELVGDLLDNQNPTVAPYAKDGEALLRITAAAVDEESANELCLPMLDEIKSRLGSYVYGVDADSIQQRVVELLSQKGKKIALAESCTGGYIAKRITDIPGSSAVFGCGFVTYSIEAKNKIIGVCAETLEKYGAVSEQTAGEMARGAREAGNADIGIGVTGIAGPESDSSNLPAGLIYIALADKDRTFVDKLITGRSNDREYNRYVASSYALNMARLYLEGFLGGLYG